MASSGKYRIAFLATNQTKGAFSSIRRDVSRTQGTLREFGRSFGLYFGAAGIGLMTRSLVGAGLKLQAFEQQFRAATGSVEMAESEMNFAMKTANDLGLEFEGMAGRYAKFIAASQGTGVAGSDVRDIFMGLSMASRALFLDTEAVNGAFRAVEQVMSKGTIQAEEIRGQLGERIPGAFNVLAEAMDTTTEGLGKMLERGEVTSKELAKMGRRLQELYGPQSQEAAKTAIADFNRLKNRMFELKAAIGGALLPTLGDLAKFFAANMTTAIAWVRAKFRALSGTVLQFTAGVINAKNAIVNFFQFGTQNKAEVLAEWSEEAIRLRVYIKEANEKLIAMSRNKNVSPQGLQMMASDINAAEAALALLDGKMHSLTSQDITVEGLKADAQALLDSADFQKVLAEMKEYGAGVELILRQAAGVAGDTSKKTLTAAEKYVNKLREKIIVLGMTEEAQMRYEFSLMAASAESEDARKEILKLGEAYLTLKSDTDKASKSVDTVNDLLNQIARTKFSDRDNFVFDWVKKLGEGALPQDIQMTEQLAGRLFDLENQAKDTFMSIEAAAKSAAEGAQRALADFLFDPFQDGLRGMVKGVVDTMRRIIAEMAAARIMKSSGFQKFFGSILGGIFGGFGGGGGSSAAASASSSGGGSGPLTYAGGGFTGMGMRSGGIDGKGGFPAILHPNETVIDHQGGKGRSSGSSTIVINNNIDARHATSDFQSALPGILEAQNRRTKAEISDMIQRGRFA